MQQRLSTKEEYLGRVTIVVEYINTHLGENIDIGILAELSGFSPYHFHRIMRAYLREPLGRLLSGCVSKLQLDYYVIRICRCMEALICLYL